MSILDNLITDRQQSDISAKNEKGTYNYTDLNRVNEAVEYIAGMLRSYGYTVTLSENKLWSENDIPRLSEMAAYLANVTAVAAVKFSSNPPVLPVGMEKLTAIQANNIEKFLKELGIIAKNIPQTWYFSGEIYGGEANL